MLPEQLIDKQGPLGRAWLASHWERKLSKTQFLQTNLEKTIDAIESNQEQEPIALHISGQLLLGVVRIYSRKTRYLLEDCNEALVKIKLAFKKGDVNIPDIQYTSSSNNAITLQDKLTEFDILLPDVPFNKRPLDLDHIIEPFNGEQDSTLSDIQQSFSFGDWENVEQGRLLEQGERGTFIQDVEMGRRENEPGFADTSFTMDAIADPLKDMNINDDDGGIDFDFDIGDGDDFRNNDTTNEFHMREEEGDSINESQIDTLMQIGILPDEAMFNIDNQQQPVRRRKRLVVDKVTEIPHEDIRKHMENPSALLDKSNELVNLSGEITTIDLRKPTGSANLGSSLESMFERLSRKRRGSASLLESGFDKEARLDTTTTPGDGGFGYDGDFDGGVDIDYDVGDNFNDAPLQLDMGSVNGSENTFGSQSLNEKTRTALDHINSELMHTESVSFNHVLSKYYQKPDKARLFYDILLLSTKGKIKPKQERAYGEIQITATA